mgnify:CR=1 FL=1
MRAIWRDVAHGSWGVRLAVILGIIVVGAVVFSVFAFTPEGRAEVDAWREMFRGN